MYRRELLAALSGGFVGIAGCTSTVFHSSTPENRINTAQTSEENIPVTGGTLPVEPEPVFARVQELVNADVPPPRFIHLTSTKVTERPVRVTNDFYRTMDIRTVPPGSSPLPSGYTTPNRIYLASDNGTPAQIEQTLAHEFTHTIQMQSKTFHPTIADATTDAGHATAALIEGGATYVTDQYTERYLSQAQLESERVHTWYENAPPAMKLRLAAYYFGSRYIEQRLSSPANLSTLYATPPTTTKQLIHNLPPTAEPPTALHVTSTTETTDWIHSSEDRLGELSVRVILGTYLPDDQAADAAAGWESDHLLQYSNPSISHSGFAWVLRWDDAQNATQFQTAFGRYLASRADQTNGVWVDETVALRGDRVNERTYVVVVGPRSFVANVTVTNDETHIRIRIGS